MTLQHIAKDTCLVRDTAAHKGRTIAVVPGTRLRAFSTTAGSFSTPATRPLSVATNT